MIWGSKTPSVPRQARAVSLRGGMICIFLIFILYNSSFAFSFAVFGDNRDGDKVFSEILDKINNDKEIEFAVSTGDFVSYGQKAQYEKYLNLTKKYRFKIYHVMGNHDAVLGGHKLFAKYFGPNYYSFDHKNSHFVILDNSFRGTFDGKQYNYLFSVLEANKGKNIFVFFHKPMFDPSETYPNYVMSERQIAEKLLEIFKKYRVRYVFAGHIHGYAKAERGSVIYLVTAGAGAPLYLPRYLGGFYHYVKITVEGDRIKDEVIKITGQEK